ncbi:sulfotransferase domain-containing protein [Natronosporangium hydrolyticum]|uniref:Sulfotransferase domain-containing protein n=1 Tax=Natronosporangium hydrolyticum TaxID=2811111 RepID=A0A895YMJ6_9ACTN|nr:sulfotransferase [Natronosporangium hydrolyticum]QSB15906.1 sulfotransferase domain-containing protein [Natronosporangium hydrolyticum]
MGTVTAVRGRLRQQAWQGAVVLARTTGRLSANRRLTPDFLVVGAQRAGTTSLYQALRQHPSFLPARLRKGVHYFDMAYHRPMSWYRAHFPTRRRAAAVAATLGAPVVTGEFSPYYMWHPLAPARIAADLPGVKVVAMLRDPVERAYSAHAHELARGFETEPFERAVELEPARLAGEVAKMTDDPGYASHAVQHQAYLARGRYHEQLTRLSDLVGRERLHVIDSEEFFTAPEQVFSQLCEFLEIPPRTTGVRFARHNARPRSDLPAGLRRRLEDSFATADEELARWWGRTPSWRAYG